MTPYRTAIDAALLADLADEHAVLDELLAGGDLEMWRLRTPALPWTVADQVRHLVSSERAAALSLAGRGEELFTGRAAVDPVEAAGGPELLGEWRAARQVTLDRFGTLDDRSQVVWGAGPMSARSFAQSRLMETWAHGLDCFAAAGEEPLDSARLRHVADLARRALPYAFAVAGEEPPGNPRRLRLDLAGPGGERWELGPEDAEEAIAGAAGEWCRVAVRRLPVEATSLAASGPLAAAALRVARAYLAD